MPEHVEDGRPVVICPRCHKDVSGRVIIVYPPHPGPAFSGPSVWHCPDCGREWPREPAAKRREE